MPDVILDYILREWPSLAIFIVVVVSACIIIRRFTKWEGRHENNHKIIERSLIKNKEEHTGILEMTSEILQRIDLIERFLIKNGGAEYNTFAQTYSPIQLNPLGRKLFEESKAKDFFDEKKEALLKLLSSELRKLKTKTVTALDVQDYAYRLCIAISDNNDFKHIKDFIFIHPVYEKKTVSVGTICMLMGIELRNAYLELHPEINQD